MRIAIRDTYKALQPLKFCMQVRWGCAALSQERAAFSQASKAMLVFREISLMLCNRAVVSGQGSRNGPNNVSYYTITLSGPCGHD